MTYRQAQQAGGQVRKGEKATGRWFIRTDEAGRGSRKATAFMTVTVNR